MNNISKSRFFTAVASIIFITTVVSLNSSVSEVFVSATKKDESASKIPVTVTALTEE